MSKRTRAEKWVKEHPDVFVYTGYAFATLGLALWIRHAMKTAEVYPVAYGVDVMDDGRIMVVKLWEDNSITSMLFDKNPGI